MALRAMARLRRRTEGAWERGGGGSLAAGRRGRGCRSADGRESVRQALLPVIVRLGGTPPFSAGKYMYTFKALSLVHRTYSTKFIES
jgi:hypothetical protein